MCYDEFDILVEPYYLSILLNFNTWGGDLFSHYVTARWWIIKLLTGDWNLSTHSNVRWDILLPATIKHCNLWYWWGQVQILSTCYKKSDILHFYDACNDFLLINVTQDIVLLKLFIGLVDLFECILLIITTQGIGSCNQNWPSSELKLDQYEVMYRMRCNHQIKFS